MALLHRRPAEAAPGFVRPGSSLVVLPGRLDVPGTDCSVPAISPTSNALNDLVNPAMAAGLRRIHVLAWRDIADDDAGGSETHLTHIANRWAAAGLEVTIRTSEAPGHPHEEHRDGTRVIRRGGRFDVFPRAILAELAGRHGPADALVEFWNGVPFFSPVWFRGPRVTVLHHVHRRMWSLMLPPGLAAFGRTLEGRIAPPFYRNTPVVTLCSSSRTEIIELLGLPAGNVEVAWPGIDPYFTPDESVRSGEPLIVAVGRLVPHKRFDALIDVVVDLHFQRPDLRLEIAGDGPHRNELEAQVRRLDAESFITLRGRVSDEELRDLYRRGWVLAASSIAEGFGMTVTEAAACATPAVATRIAGHCDAVEEGVGGLLSSSPTEFRSHLERVLGDPVLRQSLSSGARRRAETLTWDATAEQVFAPLARQVLGTSATTGR